MDRELSSKRNRGRKRGGGGGGRRNSGNSAPAGRSNHSNSRNKKSENPKKRTKHTQGDVADAKTAPLQAATGPTPSASMDTTPTAHITNHRFEDLKNISSETRRSLRSVFGYECMTVVQHETLPLILEGDDCLAKAKTGTGKTLAFMIPTIERIARRAASKENDICSLVISPTRELALQISTETTNLIRFHKGIKVVVCVGGTNANKDIQALRNNKNEKVVLIATPGRLLDHLQNLSGLTERMAKLDTLIFDEADHLLDIGFRPEIDRILKLLKASEATRQTLLFSATVPQSVNEIAGLALRPKYNFVDTVGEEAEQTHEHVAQELFVVPQEDHVAAMMNLLARETRHGAYKIIVFFTTARLTGFMAELFNSVSNQLHYKVLEIHSRKSQGARKRASDQFRSSKSAVLFSSDVSARGMDYPDVTFVLQVGLTDRDQYIHRLGRTARAGKKGKGALLLANYEENYMVRRELQDMPLQKMDSVPALGMESVAVRAIRNVEEQEALRISAEQSYRAWLGYYNSSLKKVGWNKKQLVVQANMWAEQSGLKEQPGLEKKTIGKMGLRDVPGLRIVKRSN